MNRGFTEIKAKLREFELLAIKKHKLIVTDKEWNYLIWISENNNLTITELAKKLGIGKGTLSNNLKSLVNKKLLTKEKGEDKRLINLTPTPLGKKYIDLHDEVHKKIKSGILKLISEDEFKTLINIGRKLIK